MKSISSKRIQSTTITKANRMTSAEEIAETSTTVEAKSQAIKDEIKKQKIELEKRKSRKFIAQLADMATTNEDITQ